MQLGDEPMTDVYVELCHILDMNPREQVVRCLSPSLTPLTTRRHNLATLTTIGQYVNRMRAGLVVLQYDEHIQLLAEAFMNEIVRCSVLGARFVNSS